MISLANRGMDFESLINVSNEYYMTKGVAAIVKIPTEFIPLREGGQIRTVKVTRKSICDYLGEYKGRPIAFEAKTTTKDFIYKRIVKDNQSGFLEKWASLGGVSFL